MTSTTNLQFDKMVVDTKLAQNYLKTNESEFFPSKGVTEDDVIIYDNAKNKIHCRGYKTESAVEYKRDQGYSINLLNLANTIQDQVDLFCQLEFMIRGKPIRTTMLELNMIIKYLRYQASLSTYENRTKELIFMKNDTPLIDLGCISLLSPAVDILAAENIAVVCYLFTKLCRCSGLKDVNLSFVSNNDVAFDEDNSIIKNKVLEGGCIGVVTTQSDVDSAVNVLLSVPKGELWGLRRILVQESAIERFKTEMFIKTQTGLQADAKPELQALCTDLYVYEDKVFLREYVGSVNRNYVIIESFRTVKELLTLIEDYSPFCVSLWSQGTAESNEIAFGISSPMVWVNCYGTIGDPHQLSLAYFSQIVVRKRFEANVVLDKVRKLQKAWSKLTYAERRSKTLALVVTQMNSPENDELMSYVKCLRTAESCTKNFVHVGASDLVIGIHKPRDVYAIKWDNSPQNAADIIHNLLNGSGFLFDSSMGDENRFKSLLSLFESQQLPVGFTPNITPDVFPLTQTTRIIHTSFGTIFAN